MKKETDNPDASRFCSSWCSLGEALAGPPLRHTECPGPRSRRVGVQVSTEYTLRHFLLPKRSLFFFLLVLKENKHVKRSQRLVAPALCLPGLMESETLAPGFRGDRAAPPWPLVTTGRPGACSRESEVALHLDKRLPAVRVGRAAFAGPTARLITSSSFLLRLRPAQGAGGCPEGVCVCVFLSTGLPRTPGVEPGDGEKEAGAEGLQAARPGPQDPCCWGRGARLGGLSWGSASQQVGGTGFPRSWAI